VPENRPIWDRPAEQPPPQAKTGPWLARHKAAATIVGIASLAVVAVVVLATVNAVGGSNAVRQGASSSATAATSAARARASQPSPTPSLVPLSAGQRKFVRDIRSGLGHPGYTLTGATDIQIATAASDICANRANGSTQAQVASYMSGNWNLPKKQVVRAAERDLCPKYLPRPPPKPVVVLSLSGSGIRDGAVHAGVRGSCCAPDFG
jgi:hypothetical protein